MPLEHVLAHHRPLVGDCQIRIRLVTSRSDCCRQAPTELEAHRQQTRSLLIQWGMPLGGDEFAAVYEWGQQHRLIDETLDGDEFGRLAHDVFVGLVEEGDFVRSDLGFVYRWQ